MVGLVNKYIKSHLKESYDSRKGERSQSLKQLLLKYLNQKSSISVRTLWVLKLTDFI